MRRGLVVSFSALVVFLFWGQALAQNWQGSPTYGEYTLSTGFTPDPASYALTAGGSNTATDIDPGCRGFIADSPDVRVQFTAGSLPLRFYVDDPTHADTTLVINGPDGQWYCNDDWGSTLQPVVDFTPAQSGQYDIFVGSYSEDEYPSVNLYVTELTSNAPGN